MYSCPPVLHEGSTVETTRQFGGGHDWHTHQSHWMLITNIFSLKVLAFCDLNVLCFCHQIACLLLCPVMLFASIELGCVVQVVTWQYTFISLWTLKYDSVNVQNKGCANIYNNLILLWRINSDPEERWKPLPKYWFYILLILRYVLILNF